MLELKLELVITHQDVRRVFKHPPLLKNCCIGL